MWRAIRQRAFLFYRSRDPPPLRLLPAERFTWAHLHFLPNSVNIFKTNAAARLFRPPRPLIFIRRFFIFLPLSCSSSRICRLPADFVDPRRFLDDFHFLIMGDNMPAGASKSNDGSQSPATDEHEKPIRKVLTYYFCTHEENQLVMPQIKAILNQHGVTSQ
ncbi:hypothetical protein U9M48_025154 [Paspalum notatum var. saurae]|uniref:Uncharacterized protein n=1 Tax=Paspalum notatum var. saurae TaxID=547442 RepID=A0AAQ3TUC7_PASNO